MENDTAGDGGLQRSGIPQGVALGWYIAPLQGLPLALAQAAPVTGHGGPAQREWPGSAGGRSRAGSKRVDGVPIKSGIKSGCSALTPCPHTLSPHFVPLRFVSTLCPPHHRTRRFGATRMARRSRAGSGALPRPRPRPRPRSPVLPGLPALPRLPAGGASVCLPAYPWTSRRSSLPWLRPWRLVWCPARG